MRILSRREAPFPLPLLIKGCHPAMARLMAWAPALVGASQVFPSFRTLLLPHAPHRVHRTMGNCDSALTMQCPARA